MKFKKFLIIFLCVILAYAIGFTIFYFVYTPEHNYSKDYIYDRLLGNTFLFRSHEYVKDSYDEDGYTNYQTDYYIGFKTKSILINSYYEELEYKIVESKFTGSYLKVENITVWGKKYSSIMIRLNFKPTENQHSTYGNKFADLRIYNGSNEIAYTYPEFYVKDITENVVGTYTKVNQEILVDHYNKLSDNISNIELYEDGDCRINYLDNNFSLAFYVAFGRGTYVDQLTIKLRNGKLITLSGKDNYVEYWTNGTYSIKVDY